jgi:acyl-CoA synthetase (AMP-forming)/AMP-acid ligase II
MNIVSAIKAANPTSDHLIAVVEGDARLSYGDLFDRVRLLRTALGEAGIQRGEVVSLVGHNSIDYIVASLALMEAARW